jgi:hypothetical protein
VDQVIYFGGFLWTSVSETDYVRRRHSDFCGLLLHVHPLCTLVVRAPIADCEQAEPCLYVPTAVVPSHSPHRAPLCSQWFLPTLFFLRVVLLPFFSKMRTP